MSNSSKTATPSAKKSLQILQDLLKEEEAVDAEVRKKISSQKKEILEGSEEWDCFTANITPKRCAAWASFTSQVRQQIVKSGTGFSLGFQISMIV